MSARRDLTGHVFGRLSALERNGTSRHGQARWRCRCTCGTETTVDMSNLTAGRQVSCGCYQRETTSARSTTHGATRGRKTGAYVPEYRAWSSMIQRCEDEKCSQWPNYGGRGIRVCDRWRHSYATFRNDVGPRPSAKHSLDREDVNGDYEPGNVRWATAKQQACNRRSNTKYSLHGETLCLSEWAERIGADRTSLKDRLDRGWPLEAALLTPPRR